MFRIENLEDEFDRVYIARGSMVPYISYTELGIHLFDNVYDGMNLIGVNVRTTEMTLTGN